ncbi:hypothetical protein [Mycobacterium marinum]|uniref:hypothetical protein n=1 Tax=Mycobacterium marinum TaxID=1781 RepID=UPI001C3D2997|nr:hypothetical protein [Mycobacterium marinum]
MSNSWGLEPDDMAHLFGAPFTQDQIDSAVTTLVNAAKWHIVPEQEDTVTLDVQCWESLLRLPTRHLVSVDEIRDADTATVIDADRYRVSLDLGQVRHRTSYWPSGYGRVEVDFTHGWDTVPADLLPLLAEAALLSRRDQTAKQLGAGPMSAAFDISLGGSDTNPLSTRAVFDRYRLWQPGIA